MDADSAASSSSSTPSSISTSSSLDFSLSDQDLTLLRRLQRSFSEYMRSELFRRLTFSFSGIYDRDEANTLAKNGLFNTMIKTGSRSTYSVRCCYCTFSMQSNCFDLDDWFNPIRIKIAHASYSPTCSMVWPHCVKYTNNIAFTDVRVAMNLFPTFYKNSDGKLVKRSKVLPNCSPVKELFHERLKCITCISHRRQVLTYPCAHIVVCGPCFTRLKWTCPLCRTYVTAVVKVVLPDIPRKVNF